MSMMDAMNNPTPAQPEAAPPAAAPGAGPANPDQQQMPQEAMRMADGNPEEMQALYTRLMSVISSEIWEGNGADQVAAQLADEDSDVPEIIGKFTGFYLILGFSAARAKGGMLPPVVVAAAAGETASQLTDIALMLKLITPAEADDVADAGALIGLEGLLTKVGTQMSPDEKQEYVDITKAIIEASPTAVNMAEESSEEAVEDLQEMSQAGGAPEINPEPPNTPAEGGSAMANAMGGV